MSNPMPEGVSLAEALVAAQAEMPTVKKDDTNPHFNSKFTSLDRLIDETRPFLNKHGLAIVQFPVVNDAGFPVLRTTIVHGPSGEQLAGDTPLYLGSQQTMQALGAAVTYARRYAWAAVLGVAAETDDDGASIDKPAETSPAAKPITNAQHAKIAAIVKSLDGNETPFPEELKLSDSWVDALKTLLGDRYGVSSRKELTREQATDLIDWLEAMEVPF